MKKLPDLVDFARTRFSDLTNPCFVMTVHTSYSLSLDGAYLKELLGYPILYDETIPDYFVGFGKVRSVKLKLSESAIWLRSNQWEKYLQQWKQATRRMDGFLVDQYRICYWTPNLIMPEIVGGVES